MGRLIIAVTGSMAAGKNYVCSMLENMGFYSIDADKCVHQAIRESKDLIVAAFGREAEQKNINLLCDDGSVDRRALGEILFSNKALLAKQEKIIHPRISVIINRFIDSNPDKNIIINATVLYKIPDLLKKCRAVIFVRAPFFVRFHRARKRDKLPARQILARFFSQIKIFAKYKKLNSDIYSVWNVGKQSSLQKKLEEILQTLREN